MGALLEIRTAGVQDLPAVREIFTEYARSLSYHICFESFEKELAALPDGYLVIMLATVDGQLAGCVAVRTAGDKTCEMKRLYVRAPFRGTGAGRALADQAIAWARRQGFHALRLDTLPERMPAAVSLYRSLGFYEISRSDEKLDMELMLGSGDSSVQTA